MRDPTHPPPLGLLLLLPRLLQQMPLQRVCLVLHRVRHLSTQCGPRLHEALHALWSDLSATHMRRPVAGEGAAVGAAMRCGNATAVPGQL